MRSLVRSCLVFASLVALPVSPLRAAAAVEAAPSPLLNIGYADYTKSATPGTLNARWNYANAYRGYGIATGGPAQGFAGTYHVRYFYADGKFSDEYDLVIEKTGDSYAVTWIAEGKVRAKGVGMEVENHLAVGWRRLAD